MLKNPGRRPWTLDDFNALKLASKNGTNVKSLVLTLKRTEVAIRQKAHHLKLPLRAHNRG